MVLIWNSTDDLQSMVSLTIHHPNDKSYKPTSIFNLVSKYGQVRCGNLPFFTKTCFNAVANHQNNPKAINKVFPKVTLKESRIQT